MTARRRRATPARTRGSQVWFWHLTHANTSRQERFLSYDSDCIVTANVRTAGQCLGRLILRQFIGVPLRPLLMAASLVLAQRLESAPTDFMRKDQWPSRN